METLLGIGLGMEGIGLGLGVGGWVQGDLFDMTIRYFYLRYIYTLLSL